MGGDPLLSFARADETERGIGIRYPPVTVCRGGVARRAAGGGGLVVPRLNAHYRVPVAPRSMHGTLTPVEHIRARLDACVHLAQAPEMQHHGDWLPV
jgi:hypothetical protein